MSEKIMVVGCGAAGGTAAQFARKTDRKSDITIIEQGGYPQYSKCGIPYLLSGEIKKPEDLIEFSEKWFKENRVTLLLNSAVSDVDMDEKKVVVTTSDDTRVEKSFDSLILATGGSPIVPPIQNIKGEHGFVKGVSMVRTLDDAKLLSSMIAKAERVVVVGAGLIGMEMAEVLHRRGLSVTIVEALPRILPQTLDEDVVDIVGDALPDDVMVYTNHVAQRVVTEEDELQAVVIQDKESQEEATIDADVMIIATGSKPNVALAKNIGCNIGDSGGIIVDEMGQTSVSDVYAAGDCTEYPDYVTGGSVAVGLGSIATRQGIAAGVNAAGGSYQMPSGVLQTATSRFFDVEIASVGPTFSELEDRGVVHGKFSGLSLPDYFPGGEPISVKVTVDETTGHILSAQAVGSNAAQRINVLACAVFNKMGVEEFRKLETAYAPPVAPTLDVLTLAGDVAARKWLRKKKS